MLLTQDEETPLHVSSKSGHVDIVNVLLSHGAGIDVKNEASKYSDITSIKSLLLIQYEETPLHLSSKSGHVDILNVLISHGADIHVKNKVSKYSDITSIKINDC